MTAARAALLAIALLATLLRLLPLQAGPATGLDPAEHATIRRLGGPLPLGAAAPSAAPAAPQTSGSPQISGSPQTSGSPRTSLADGSPRREILAARALAAALGATAVPLVFALTAPWASPAGGLAAALFLAVSPVAVRAAKTLSPDTLALPLALLALASLTRRRPTTGGLVAIPVASALAIGVHHLSAGPAAAPFAGAAAGSVAGGAWLLRAALPDALGWDVTAALALGVAAALLGTVRAGREGCPGATPCLGFALGGLAAALSLETPRFPDLLPALAGLAALGGAAVGDLARLGALGDLARLGALGDAAGPSPLGDPARSSVPPGAAAGWGTRPGPRWVRRGAALGLAALLVVPGAIRTVKLDRLLGRPDSRSLATRWLAEHLRPGETVALVHADLPWAKPELPSGVHTIAVAAGDRLEDLRRRGVDWLVVDSTPGVAASPGSSAALDGSLRAAGLSAAFDVEPVKPGTPRPAYDPAQPFLAPLRHVASVRRPGPRIQVWRVARPDDGR